MKTGFLLLLSILLLTINSCEYSPTGSNNKEIAIPDPDIDILVLNENELNVMRGRIIVYYSAELNGKEVKQIRVFLNETQIQSDYNTLGAVEINTSDYADGSYQLTFQLFTSTETGSLADLTGAEVFVLTKIYNVRIFNAPIITPQITELALSGNDLHIKWNKYTGIGFQKYVLLYYNTVIKEIYDPDSTDIIDPAYVGGFTDRGLRTYVAGQPFESTHKSFTSPQINFTSATVQNQNAVVLTWERNTFDNNFGEYRITRGVTEGPYLAQITGIDTTTFVDYNPIFGDVIQYGIEAVASQPINVNPHPAYLTANAIGYTLPFNDLTYVDYIPASDVYYTFMDKKLRVYDNSFNEIRSADYNLNNPPYTTAFGITNSSDGDLIYLIKDISTSDIIKVNSSTLQIEQSYNLETIAGINLGTISRIDISDNNLLAVVIQGNPGHPTLYVFDMNNMSLLTSRVLSFSSYSDFAVFSPNGKYIRVEDNLLRLEGTDLSLIGQVKKYSAFLQNSESLVQMTNTTTPLISKLQLLNCADLSLLKEVPFQNYLYDVRLSIDKAGGYIGCHSNATNYYYIIDIHNQVIKKKVPVANHQVKFQNMTLFSNYSRLPITF